VQERTPSRLFGIISIATTAAPTTTAIITIIIVTVTTILISETPQTPSTEAACATCDRRLEQCLFLPTTARAAAAAAAAAAATPDTLSSSGAVRHAQAERLQNCAVWTDSRRPMVAIDAAGRGACGWL
jgi:hypothetical protein